MAFYSQDSTAEKNGHICKRDSNPRPHCMSTDHLGNAIGIFSLWEKFRFSVHFGLKETRRQIADYNCGHLRSRIVECQAHVLAAVAGLGWTANKIPVEADQLLPRYCVCGWSAVSARQSGNLPLRSVIWLAGMIIGRSWSFMWLVCLLAETTSQLHADFYQNDLKFI
jgi:hypothetical protein